MAATPLVSGILPDGECGRFGIVSCNNA